MAYCEYRSSGAAITKNVSSENAISNKPICKVLQAEMPEDPACVLPNEPGVTCPIALYNKRIITTIEILFHQLKPKYDSAKEQRPPEGK